MTDATVREPDGSAATVREGETTTGRGSRSSDTGTGSAGLMRLPEGLAVRYRIERELPTRGNEADLFVVRLLQDGDDTPVVVKLYRANVHPKEEVLTRIAALDGQHVIRQIEHGVSEGRSYEVIEYAAEGSLADLMRETRFDEAMLKAMIREVTAGLGYLHSLDPPIVHRDVKPDNILVRRRDPLDLVLTDFGLSSVLEGGSWRASTLDRTIKYAAPEAGAGQVSREMDWWSLGIMVAEAASGRHPFAGVAEQTIGIHYSNRLPVPLDGIADERVKLLCQGLLCYDRKQRWGSEQVWRWIAGDTSLRPPVEETRQASAAVPFKFAGGSYGTIRELAAAFAANWEAAQKTVARADGLLAWLKDEAKEYEAWQWLTEITQDKAQLDPGLKVTLLLPMLDPDMPVMFEGQELTEERLLAEVAAAADGEAGATDTARTARLQQLWEHIPALAELTKGAAWLRDIQADVQKARKQVSEIITALGPDAPKIASTQTWAFTRHVLDYQAGSNLDEIPQGAAGMLKKLPDETAPWVALVKGADRSTAAMPWLLRQFEPHIRGLIAEVDRRTAEKAEVARRLAAERAAARRVKRSWYLKRGLALVLPLMLVVGASYAIISAPEKLPALAPATPPAPVVATPPTTPPKRDASLASLSNQILCRLALNITFNGWSSSDAFREHVGEVKRRSMSVDDCRLATGRRTLEQEAVANEKKKLFVLTETEICGRALNGSRSGWDSSESFRLAVDEAERRRYTVESCRVTLGRSTKDAPPALPAEASLEGRVQFPVASLNNPRAPHTNFRDAPGNKSNVVAKLSNGTHVIILGSAPSPTSGHVYCRVQTANGYQGYIDHELLSSSCDLSFEQKQYVQDVDRRREQEALKTFTDLATIIIGIAQNSR